MGLRGRIRILVGTVPSILNGTDGGEVSWWRENIVGIWL